MKNWIYLTLTTLFTYLFNIQEALARGGGGGSGGGGGGGGGSGSGGSKISTIIILIVFIPVSIYLSYARKKQLEKARRDMALAEQSDGTWNKTEITKRVEKVFYEFQQAWSNLDAQAMKNLLTEEYYKRMVLELNVLKNEGRQNVLKDIKLTALHILNVSDESDNSKDKFLIEVYAKIKDSLIDSQTGKTLFIDNSYFKENWNFVRKNNEWYLDKIDQSTADDYSPEAEKFAEENNFYYDRDFGWLMMPNKGVLFKKTNFKVSDINHHIIGYYRNKIVEFYQYIPRPNRTVPKKYLVAQAILPKSYENILIKRKQWMNWTPRKLRRMASESVEFNNRFCFYASKNDQINTLELLNPSFMEKIYELPFELNIEIVGNTLYLYTNKYSTQNLPKMLEILSLAFDEMKM
ncbi:MAG: hypothetical protein ACD_72C00093G0002 [uncultured bacterium]|nr:MAG: hypothetical protein ACD_72C00093G0002 [uncultured bacterium]